MHRVVRRDLRNLKPSGKSMNITAQDIKGLDPYNIWVKQFKEDKNHQRFLSDIAKANNKKRRALRKFEEDHNFSHKVLKGRTPEEVMKEIKEQFDKRQASTQSAQEKAIRERDAAKAEQFRDPDTGRIDPDRVQRRGDRVLNAIQDLANVLRGAGGGQAQPQQQGGRGAGRGQAQQLPPPPQQPLPPQPSSSSSSSSSPAPKSKKKQTQPQASSSSSSSSSAPPPPPQQQAPPSPSQEQQQAQDTPPQSPAPPSSIFEESIQEIKDAPSGQNTRALNRDVRDRLVEHFRNNTDKYSVVIVSKKSDINKGVGKGRRGISNMQRVFFDASTRQAFVVVPQKSGNTVVGKEILVGAIEEGKQPRTGQKGDKLDFVQKS